jgi:hypothetical protein
MLHHHDKQKQPSSQRGNALFIVLIALAVLGMLTAAIMGDDSGDNEMAQMDVMEGRVNVTRVLQSSQTYIQTVRSMIDRGVDPGSVALTEHWEAAFDTPPHDNKLYHPKGGGLTRNSDIKVTFNQSIVGIGPTDDDTTVSGDLLVVHRLPESDKTLQICNQINDRLYGAGTITDHADATTSGAYALTSIAASTFWEDASGQALGDPGGDASLGCTDCEEKTTLCIAGGGDFYFYTVVHAR